MPLSDIEPLGLEPLAESTIGVWGPPLTDRVDRNSARSNDHEDRIVVLEGLVAAVGINPPDPAVHPLWVDAND